MQWRTDLPISRRAEMETVPSGVEIALLNSVMYEERSILRATLEMWIAANSDPIDGLKHDQRYWDHFQFYVIGD